MPNLLMMACKRDFAILKTPIKLLGLGTKVLYNIPQCPGRYGPVVQWFGLVKTRMQRFGSLVGESVGFDYTMAAEHADD